MSGEGAVPDGMRAALPIIDDPARSPDPSVCPFLRREVDGLLAVPLLEPDDANRCAAIGAPRPQSSRQQELVCLRAAHADCPRYLRGALVVSEVPRRSPPGARCPRATLAALLVLVLSAGISFGFVVQRGGIDLPVVEGGATPTALAVVTTPAPVATVSPATARPTVAPSPAPTPHRRRRRPTPRLPPSPSPAPSPSPSATPAPTDTPAATPTSTRYALLEPCPDRKDCWIYRVRSGDNLFSIANYFGHRTEHDLPVEPAVPGDPPAHG